MTATIQGPELYSHLRRAADRLSRARMGLGAAREAFKLAPSDLTAENVRVAYDAFEDAAAIAQEFGLPNTP